METIEKRPFKVERKKLQKNLKDEIIENLDTKKEDIPNWRIFNIKEIAEINEGGNKIIDLKNVNIDDNGDNYIIINGRRYNEYNGKGTPRNSIYIYRGNSLFIGDKFDGLTIWDGVLFKYINGIGDYTLFEQRKSKYGSGTIHLKEIYKSEVLRDSKILATLQIGGKEIKITKDLIEKYLLGELNQYKKNIAETAIKRCPEVSNFIEKLKEEK